MSDSFEETPNSRRDPSEEANNQPLESASEPDSGNSGSANEVGSQAQEPTSTSETDKTFQPQARKLPTPQTSQPEPKENLNSSTNESSPPNGVQPKAEAPLAMVETAFLASTASLIYLINYYFPIGPVLRMFFPVPIALVYLRWGNRASWMAAVVSGLLLSVLMGPTRSILFFVPYALIGVQLGALWKRRAGWILSISTGTLIGTLGFFFKYWLLSILVGEDLWVYGLSVITQWLDWLFVKLGFLVVPNLLMIQALALLMVIINNIVYLFVVHLVALLMLDRLGNPIPRPPHWVQVLLDY